VGSVKEHPFDPSKLIWNIATDTLPADTLNPITRIIDPNDAYPGDGLPPSAPGQRYLVTAVTPYGGNTYWGVNSVIADPNDIIEFNGNDWIVAFKSSESHDVEVVTNNYTGKKLKWDGEKWFSAYEGVYNGGFWRLYP
jgi:hypothetical protein